MAVSINANNNTVNITTAVNNVKVIDNSTNPITTVNVDNPIKDTITISTPGPKGDVPQGDVLFLNVTASNISASGYISGSNIIGNTGSFGRLQGSSPLTLGGELIFEIPVTASNLLLEGGTLKAAGTGTFDGGVETKNITATGNTLFGSDPNFPIHKFNGHVTSSGNISSSGDISAHNLTIADKSNFTSHITSSGNISSSGKLTATNASFGRIERPTSEVSSYENARLATELELDIKTHSQSITFRTSQHDNLNYLFGGAIFNFTYPHISMSSHGVFLNGGNYTAGVNGAHEGGGQLWFGCGSDVNDTFAFSNKFEIHHNQGFRFVTAENASNGTAFQIHQMYVESKLPITASSDISASGVITANIFSGSGAKLTDVTSTPIFGGSDTHVQFNDEGSPGGESGFTYNKSTDSVFIGGHITASGNISASGDIETPGIISSSKEGIFNNITASGYIMATSASFVEPDGSVQSVISPQKFLARTGSFNMTENHVYTIQAGYNGNFTGEFYLPLGGYHAAGNATSGTPHHFQFIVPYDNTKIDRVLMNSVSASGDTTLKLYTANDTQTIFGSGYPGFSDDATLRDTVEVDVTALNTTYTYFFGYPGLSRGQKVGISVQPTAKQGPTTATIIFKYTTTLT